MSSVSEGGNTTTSQEAEPLEDRHAHSVEQFRGDMRVLFRVIKDRRTPIYVPFLMLGVVIYALSPVDAIPDIIPIGGIIDETVVFLICRAFVYRVVPEEHIDEHAFQVAESSSSPFGAGKTFLALAGIQIGLIIVLLVVLGGAIFSLI